MQIGEMKTVFASGTIIVAGAAVPAIAADAGKV